VFLPNNVPYFVSALQYALIYSKNTGKVIDQAVRLAQLDSFFGREMLDNTFLLKELVQKLAERNYDVLRLFLAVAEHYGGCDQLHRLRIL